MKVQGPFCDFCGTNYHNFETKHWTSDCPYKRCNICFRSSHDGQPAFVEQCPDKDMDIRKIFAIPEDIYKMKWRLLYSPNLEAHYFFKPNRGISLFNPDEVRDFERNHCQKTKLTNEPG